MPTEAQVRQSVLDAYKRKGIENPIEENIQSSIRNYMSKSSSNAGHSRGKMLYDKYGDEAVPDFTEQLAFNLRNHAREFKSGTVGMVGYLAGALGLENKGIVDYAEELRLDGQREMQKEVANNVELQALLAWQEDEPVTFTGENANFWKWSIAKREGASVLPSLIEMAALSGIGYLTGGVAVGLASKLGKGINASKKALKVAELAKTEGKLATLANSLKTTEDVGEVALALTKRGIKEKVSKGLAAAGMTGLEGSGQYNEAMEYLTTEGGLSVEDAAKKAGLSSVIYAPIAGALEYLPMGHWAKSMGVWNVGKKEGTKIFAKSFGKLADKIAEQKLPVRMITGAVEQATMEATTEWAQYMAQVATDEAFAKGDYATPEQAIEAVTNRWKESAFDAEARASIYGGFLMGGGMGVFTPTAKTAEGKEGGALIDQARKAAEEANLLKPTKEATKKQKEAILNKAKKKKDTFGKETNPDVNEPSMDSRIPDAKEPGLDDDIPDGDVPDGAGINWEKNASKLLKQIKKVGSEKDIDKAGKAWDEHAEFGDFEGLAMILNTQHNKIVGGKNTTTKQKKVKTQEPQDTTGEDDLSPLDADEQLRVIELQESGIPAAEFIKPFAKDVDVVAVRKLIADNDTKSPLFEKPKKSKAPKVETPTVQAFTPIDINDKKITISKVREIAANSEIKIDIPKNLKTRVDIINHVNNEMSKVQPVEQVKTTGTLHTGGATGADSIFEASALKSGHEVKSYSFKGHKTQSSKPVILGKKILKIADEKLKKANKTIKRAFPTKNEMVNNLLRRNWQQVDNADYVVAVGPLVNNIVTGGTGWAVQMARDEGKTVHVFNTTTNQWMTSENGKKFKKSSAPTLEGNYAGIGSRRITEAGKVAIESLYGIKQKKNKKNKSKTPVKKAPVQAKTKTISKKSQVKIDAITKKIKALITKTNVKDKDKKYLAKLNVLRSQRAKLEGKEDTKKPAPVTKKAEKYSVVVNASKILSRELSNVSKRNKPLAKFLATILNKQKKAIKVTVDNTLVSPARANVTTHRNGSVSVDIVMNEEWLDSIEKSNKGYREQTILHETIHAMLLDITHKRKTNKKLLSTAENKILKKMEALFASTVEKFAEDEKYQAVQKAYTIIEEGVSTGNFTNEAKEKVLKKLLTAKEYTLFKEGSVDYYGLFNLDEFISEAFTNSEFQNLLKDTKFDIKDSLWDKLVALITEYLGLKPKDRNAVSQMIGFTIDLVTQETQDGEIKTKPKSGNVRNNSISKAFNPTKKISFQGQPVTRKDIINYELILNKLTGSYSAKLGVKRYGSQEKLIDAIKDFEDGKLVGREEKVMAIYMRNLQKLINGIPEEDRVTIDEDIFSATQEEDEIPTAGQSIPDDKVVHRESSKKIFINELGANITSKMYAKMLNAASSGKYKNPQEFKEKYFDTKVFNKLSKMMPEDKVKAYLDDAPYITNMIYNFFQKKSSVTEIWNGSENDYARIFFEVIFDRDSNKLVNDKFNDGFSILGSNPKDVINGRIWDKLKQRWLPNYMSSNAIEEARKRGETPLDIRTLFMSDEHILGRHGSVNKWWYKKSPQKINSKFMQELFNFFGESYEDNLIEDLVVPVGAKGTDESTMLLATVEKKWTKIQSQKKFIKYLDNEIDPIDSDGKKYSEGGSVLPRLTESNKVEYLASADSMPDSNPYRYAQLIGQHEWAKSVKHNQYAMPGFWKGVEDFFNRLRIDFAEGYTIKGMDKLIKDGEVNNKMMVIPTDTIVRKPNGEEVTYGSFDGAIFSGQRWLRAVEQLIGMVPTKGEHHLSFIKGAFRKRSVDGNSYLGTKSGLYEVPDGWEFYKPGSLTPFATATENGFVTENGEMFDHIASPNEAKIRAGEYSTDYELIQINQEDMRITYTNKAKAKDTSVAPFMSGELFMHPDNTQVVTDLIDELKNQYVGNAVEHIEKLYSFLEGGYITDEDGKEVFMSGEQLLANEIVKDIQEGKAPTQIQLAVQKDPSGSILLHESFVAELAPYFNNKFIVDGAYKGRRLDGTSIQVEYKPVHDSTVGRSQVKFSGNATPIIRSAYKAFIKTLDISEALFLKKPLKVRQEELNAWLASEDNSFYILGSRQPVNKPTNARPFKVVGFYFDVAGAEVYHNAQDVKEILEGDWDGDKGYYDVFRDGDKKFLDAYLKALESDEVKFRERIIRLEHLSKKKEKGSSSTLSNLGSLFKAIDKQLKVAGAVGSIVSANGVFKSLSLKNFSITYNGVEYKLRKLSGKDFKPNYRVPIPLRLDMVQDEAEWAIMNQAKDYVEDKKGNKISWEDAQAWTKDKGRLYQKTTVEHMFTMMTQMATDEAKFGLLAKLGFSQDFLISLMVEEEMPKEVSKLFNQVYWDFNQLQKRQGRGHGKINTLNDNVAASELLSNLYDIKDPKKFTKKVNKMYQLTKDKKAKIQMENKPTIIEEMLMVLGTIQNERIGDTETGMYSNNPLRYEDSYEDFAHWKAVEAFIKAIPETLGFDLSAKEYQKALLVGDKIIKEFYNIWDSDVMEEDGTINKDIRLDYNDEVEAFIEDNLEAWDSLTEKQQQVITVRFLTGIDTKNKSSKVVTKVKIKKLMPMQFLDGTVISAYAKARLKVLRDISAKDGDTTLLYGKEFEYKTSKIRSLYEKILKPIGWNFSVALKSAKKAEKEAKVSSGMSEYLEKSNVDTKAADRATLKYQQEAKVHIDNMVGDIKPEEIEKATGVERSRLMFAKALNSIIYTDIVSIGHRLGWATEELENQVSGWNSYLSRFNHGIPVTPETIKFGERKALGLFKRASKVVARRSLLERKGLKTNKVEFLHRAVGRPEVVAFMWDRTGIAGRIVERATKHADIIQQQYSRIYDKVGQQHEAVIESVVNGVDGGLINLGNSGLSYIQMPDNNGSVVKITDFKEENGIEYYYVSTRKEIKNIDKKGEIQDRDDTAETVDKWMDSSELQISKIEYDKALSDAVVGTFLNEVLDGEKRYIKFHSSKNFIKNSMKDNLGNEVRNKTQSAGRRKNIKIGNITYQYILLKRNETSLSSNTLVMPEYYDAYVVNYRTDEEAKNGEKPHDLLYDKEFVEPKMPSDGWYGATAEGTFTKPKSKVSYQAYINFKKLKNQPAKAIVGNYSEGKHGVPDPVGFWRLLDANRLAMKKTFDLLKEKSDKAEGQMARFNERLWTSLKAKGMSKKQINKYIKSEFLIGGINDKLSATEDSRGRLRLSARNSGFSQIAENYSPRLFSIGSLYRMIDDNYARIQGDIERISDDLETETKKKVRKQLKANLEVLNDDLENFHNLKYNYGASSDNKEEVNKVIISRKILNAKSRGIWTNAFDRRKDAGVISDYINSSLRVAYNNELVADLFESTVKMTEAKVNDDIIGYASNKVKQAIGDPGVRGLLGKDRNIGNYEWVAKMLNKLPIATKYDAESARSFILTAGGFSAMRMLGSTGALQNNTQIANGYIRYGASIIFDVWGKLHSKTNSKVWVDRVALTGVENTLSTFEHFMLQDSTVSWNDFGLLPGTKIPSKNLVNWAKLLRLSKADFIKGASSIKEFEKLDEFIAKLQSKFEGVKKQDIQYVRESLYDLMTMDKKDSENRALVERRIKAIFGDVADNRFKAMVTWKLSWWLGTGDKAGPGAELFTFTQGEQNMRRVIALAAITDAVRKGVIAIPETITGVKQAARMERYINSDELYSNPDAIEIGRKAVYATMFGMSETHLGEAFSGIFKVINQFRGYPTQQSQFEYDTIRAFMDGSKNTGDSIARIIKVQARLIEAIAKGKSKEFLQNANSADRDAIIMVRLLYTRFLMSALSTTIRLIPMASAVMKKFAPFDFAYSAVRGGESPALSMVLKLMTWTTLAMMGYDDDDKIYSNMEEDSIRGLMMFTVPALLGMLARDTSEFYEWATLIEDDATIDNVVGRSPLIGG